MGGILADPAYFKTVERYKIAFKGLKVKRVIDKNTLMFDPTNTVMSIRWN